MGCWSSMPCMWFCQLAHLVQHLCQEGCGPTRCFPDIYPTPVPECMYLSVCCCICTRMPRLQVVFGFGCSMVFAYYLLCKPAQEAEAEDALSAPLLANASQGSLTSLMARMQHRHQASMAHLMLNAAKVAVAGMLAGIVGIGGGLVLAPMLLDAGIHPQVRGPGCGGSGGYGVVQDLSL